MFSKEQAEFFDTNSFLRLEKVFTREEVDRLSNELNYVIETFCTPGPGWQGPWRKDKQYLNPDEEQKAQLVATHELQHYSPAWGQAIFKPALVEADAGLIGPEVEFHHMTLHAKAPGYGTPFPMHQDHPFYPHETGAYIDAIIHVDSADENSGCLKFLAGSHKLGALQHVLEGAPHLPPDRYRIEDAVSCPAEPGDVVLFGIHTIHGSALNRRDRWRRVVRLGYRNPYNQQTGGQAMGRPGIMVAGVRPKIEGQAVNVYGNWAG